MWACVKDMSLPKPVKITNITPVQAASLNYARRLIISGLVSAAGQSQPTSRPRALRTQSGARGLEAGRLPLKARPEMFEERRLRLEAGVLAFEGRRAPFEYDVYGPHRAAARLRPQVSPTGAREIQLLSGAPGGSKMRAVLGLLSPHSL